MRRRLSDARISKSVFNCNNNKSKKGTMEMCDKKNDGEKRIDESQRGSVENKQDRHFSGDAVHLHANESTDGNMRCRADIVRPPSRPSGTSEK